MDSDEVLDLKAQIKILEAENRGLRQRIEGSLASEEADRSFPCFTVGEGDRIDICGGLIQIFVKGGGRSQGSKRLVISAPRDLLVRYQSKRKIAAGV